MRKAFTIDVPHPCGESWEGMEPRTEGRFCNACQKTVYDFTQFTDQEFIAFFQQQQEMSCGRFNKRQLSIVIPSKRKVLFPFGKLPPLAAATLIAAGMSIAAPAQSVTKAEPTHVVVGDTLLQSKPLVKQLLLKGKVLDEKGEPVIGGSIVLKATAAGTVSDADGNFELPVAESRNYAVEIRYPGIENREVTMRPGVPVTVTVAMKDAADIGEVIMLGGIRSKEDRTIRKQ